MSTFLRPGDTLEDRSSFTVIEGDDSGRSILTDRWGVLYVTNESNEVQYVGVNPLNTEVEFKLPSFGLGGR